MPGRLAGLTFFLWFVFMFVCPSGSVSTDVLPLILAFTSTFHIWLLLRRLSQSSWLNVLSSCVSWASDLLSLCLSSIFFASFLRPSVLLFHVSFYFFLPLLRYSSVALFIHSHSLPCCQFCLFVFYAFWSSFIWAVDMVGRHTQAHIGAHTCCMQRVIHRHTNTQSNFKKLGTVEKCGYIHPHTNALHGFTRKKKEVFSGWVTLYSVHFPLCAVKQQSSEAKTMATASAALTMGSRSHDITRSNT